MSKRESWYWEVAAFLVGTGTAALTVYQCVVELEKSGATTLSYAHVVGIWLMLAFWLVYVHRIRRFGLYMSSLMGLTAQTFMLFIKIAGE